ncbi:MAG: hypothetical protein ABJE95_08370 [Byssovorax sp.]
MSLPRSAFFLGTAAALIWFSTTGACTAAPSGGFGGSGPATSSVSSASSDVGGGFTTSSAGDSTGTGGACVGTSAKAALSPLDIFVMLDQSGSMLQDAGNSLSRWKTIQSALAAFVKQPSTGGIGMGLQFFGLPQPAVPGCSAHPCMQDSDCVGGCTVCLPQGLCQAPYNPDIDSCDAIDYAWAEIPIQPLPGVGSAILASIAAHAPGTNTPTAPALQGAIDHATAWQKAHPDRLTVVAFATDGLPSECDIDPVHLNAIAAAGLAGTPSIKSFVIGVGPALQALDAIAAAGGTTTAFHVDVDPQATDQLVSALNTIRGAAIQCTYQLPAPPSGKTLDFTLVNVTYTPGGGAAKSIPRVADAAHCPASGDAWYYDASAPPTRILLCKATCAEVEKDLMAEVDVVLGCATIVK